MDKTSSNRTENPDVLKSMSEITGKESDGMFKSRLGSKRVRGGFRVEKQITPGGETDHSEGKTRSPVTKPLLDPPVMNAALAAAVAAGRKVSGKGPAAREADRVARKASGDLGLEATIANAKTPEAAAAKAAAAAKLAAVKQIIDSTSPPQSKNRDSGSSTTSSATSAKSSAFQNIQRADSNDQKSSVMMGLGSAIQRSSSGKGSLNSRGSAGSLNAGGSRGSNSGGSRGSNSSSAASSAASGGPDRLIQDLAGNFLGGASGGGGNPKLTM
jgi:hypothetical protein